MKFRVRAERIVACQGQYCPGPSSFLRIFCVFAFIWKEVYMCLPVCVCVCVHNVRFKLPVLCVLYAFANVYTRVYLYRCLCVWVLTMSESNLTPFPSCSSSASSLLWDENSSCTDGTTRIRLDIFIYFQIYHIHHIYFNIYDISSWYLLALTWDENSSCTDGTSTSPGSKLISSFPRHHSLAKQQTCHSVFLTWYSFYKKHSV